VRRPKASTPLPCHLLLCRLLHGYPYPWVSGRDTSLACQVSQAPLLCWPWATPEAVDLKETPSCPAVLSSGSLHRGPTALTLVNARGRYGTQAPQSRADNLFSKETMASPYRPTWHPVTGQAQCTEVTPSCSSCDQRTRGLIVRWGLNVACASQVYVKSFKIARSRNCSITCTCSYTLHLLPRAFSDSFLRIPKLSLINHQRYNFYALIALYS